MRRLRSFLRRPRRDKLLLAEALAAVVAVRLALWVVRYRRLRRLAEAPRPRPSRPARTTARHIAWAVQRAAAFVPGASCLPQALAALWLMRRRGIPGELRFGVRQAAGAARIDAHAWVEAEGRVVIGQVADLREFTVLEQPSSSRPSSGR